MSALRALAAHRSRLYAVIALAMVAAAAILITGTTLLGSQAKPAGCSATQPVYSASYKLIGTWHVTLPAGQSVALPDGDTATCTAHDQLVVG